jgi:hypothetical protein
VVNGEGYECKKEVIILTTHESLVNIHTILINKTIVKLSRDECDHMVLTRRCDQILMQCQDNKCVSIQELNYELNYGVKLLKKYIFIVFIARFQL